MLSGQTGTRAPFRTESALPSNLMAGPKGAPLTEIGRKGKRYAACGVAMCLWRSHAALTARRAGISNKR